MTGRAEKNAMYIRTISDQIDALPEARKLTSNRREKALLHALEIFEGEMSFTQAAIFGVLRAQNDS